MALQELISLYGHTAVTVGTFLEGETILILAGFAAHRGYLELPWVIICAFFGTLCGDQLYFYIGRHKGKGLLDKRPGWKSKAERVFSLLEHQQIWLILSFRFFYGFRTLIPFVIGASDISPLRFLLFNTLCAAIWALVIGVCGYLFGSALEILIGDIQKYELLAFAVLAAIGLMVWLVYFRKGPGKTTPGRSGPSDPHTNP